MPVKGVDKKEATNAKTNSKIMNAQEMLEKGFNKGTIVTTKSSGACSYILTIEKYKDKLDPINLTDFFKGDVPQKVWVKFGSLRMPNRCADARPVSITEIKDRDQGE